MGGCDGGRPRKTQPFQNCNGQRRTFCRVCTCTQFVQQNQRVIAGLFHHFHNILHVRGEGGQALFDALFISDIRINLLEYGKLTGRKCRNMQPALGHHGQQTCGFQCYGLTARIWPGNHQGGIFRSSHCHIDWNHFLFLNQRMTCLLQIHQTAFIHSRCIGFHHYREFPLGKVEIHLCQQLLVVHQIMEVFCNRTGQFGQNPFDFCFFCQLQLTELIVQVHDNLRFDEDGRSGVGLVMDNAGDSAPVFGLDRHYIPAVTHGNDGILQKCLIIAGTDNLSQAVSDGFILPYDSAADVPQFRRCTVRHFVFRNDAAVNVVCQPRKGRQDFCHAHENGQFRQITLKPGKHVAGYPDVIQYLQKLTHGQGSALPAEMKRRFDVINLTQRCITLGHNGTACFTGFLQGFPDFADVRIWSQLCDALFRHHTAGLLPEHLDDFRILQYLKRLLIHSFSCIYPTPVSV